ncbi:AAA-12 domain-containing protein [Fusarium sp. Ph1]|nr:AAA-12 domain-containing protein [Fusarium sp. Ph1]
MGPDGFAIARRRLLLPIFIHCENSYCHIDPITKSKSDRDQVIVVLDFILDFVSSTAGRVRHSQIAIITPYTANVDVIKSVRRGPKYAAIASMKPAKTIYSFQGQESEIVVAIMATTKQAGPGMTTDEHHLNVMLSRHRSGLIIVGDIHVTGMLDGERNKGRRHDQVGRDKFKVIGANGEVSWMNATVLRSVHQALWESNRVITV